jgi:hypothetical protein
MGRRGRSVFTRGRPKMPGGIRTTPFLFTCTATQCLKLACEQIIGIGCRVRLTGPPSDEKGQPGPSRTWSRRDRTYGDHLFLWMSKGHSDILFAPLPPLIGSNGVLTIRCPSRRRGATAPAKVSPRIAEDLGTRISLPAPAIVPQRWRRAILFQSQTVWGLIFRNRRPRQGLTTLLHIAEVKN